MNFLADENYPLPSIRRLRLAGHDVAAIIMDSPGAPDKAVLGGGGASAPEAVAPVSFLWAIWA